MAAGYSQYELRDIDSSTSLAVSKKRDMMNLIKEANEMGYFARFMDSKVPDKKWSLFRLFTLKLTDPEVLEKEFKKHHTLFEKMEIAFNKARNGDEDAGEALEDAYDHLLQVCNEDESKISEDDSRMSCKLRKSIVAERPRLESSMKRVECANTRRQLRKTKEDYGHAVNEVRTLTTQMERARDDYVDMTERFNRLMIINEQLFVQQENLRQENALIKTMLHQIIDERNTDQP